MQTDKSSTEQAHVDAGDGVERTIIQARGGVRQGVTKVLVISVFLSIVAIGAVWLLSPLRTAHTRQSAQTAAPTSAHQQNALKNQVWDQRRLGAAGLEKCSAFRKVLSRTAELRRSRHGSMSSSEIAQIAAELNTAKMMPPASVTPVECGVPLG